jgi:hypothetical protein
MSDVAFPMNICVPLRSPDDVMRLAVMGSSHQTRLSFMRILLRRMVREGWRVQRTRWDIDARGVGRAVYRASGPARAYSLVAFGHDLPPDMRTDRVIATAWDATFALVDGDPSDADLDRLAANVPVQEAGRVSARELTLSRANRSVRMFDHTVDALASGHQPDPSLVGEVGYLMRTTAVYGSGKFGARDYEAIADRPEFASPFQAEMLTVYLIREFTLDLVEHLARSRSPGTAVALSPALRRAFGIGNSTGLGLAPFLVGHPAVLAHWVAAREHAIAAVRSLQGAASEDVATFMDRLARARASVAAWSTDDLRQQARVADLARDLVRVEEQSGLLSRTAPWDRLYRWADDHLSLEGREVVASLMLEPYPDIVDPCEALYRVDEGESFRIDGGWRVHALREAIERDYAWALAIDFTDPRETARFWYVSQEKLEPRLGERHEEDGAELELPLGVARDVRALQEALAAWDPATPVGRVLMDAPQHRHVVRRIQIAARSPYSEIRANLLAADMLPLDLLRFKLAMFGATRFDPRSDRWLRITMFQGAPCAGELSATTADDWVYPAAGAPARP